MSNSYYFSHDMGTRSDIKIKRLLAKHKLAGYGCFWAIIEDLYVNANALPTDYESIAYDLRTDPELVKSIIEDFDLFVIEDGYFGSLSVERRLNERANKSVKAKQSAICRWSKSKDNANAMRTQSDSNAIKERKGKEIKDINKIKEIKKKRSADEVMNECLTHYRTERQSAMERLTAETDPEKQYTLKKIVKIIDEVAMYIRDNELYFVAGMNGQLTVNSLLNNPVLQNPDRLKEKLVGMEESDKVKKAKNPTMWRTLLTWFNYRKD